MRREIQVGHVLDGCRCLCSKLLLVANVLPVSTVVPASKVQKKVGSSYKLDGHP